MSDEGATSTPGGGAGGGDEGSGKDSGGGAGGGGEKYRTGGGDGIPGGGPGVGGRCGGSGGGGEGGRGGGGGPRQFGWLMMMTLEMHELHGERMGLNYRFALVMVKDRQRAVS